MIVIIDYGVGNLFSLKSTFSALGVQAEVSSDKNDLRTADRIILPGVGAFADAANKLRDSGMADAVIAEAKKGKPLLGICLGMQLLFDKSYEYGEHAGLGLIPGAVRPIADRIEQGLKIPHMGWNGLQITQKTPLFRFINNGDHVYFVHSYFADMPDNYVIATADYGGTLTAAVQNGNVYGCQFHPEKSGAVGLNILRAFCETEEKAK